MANHTARASSSKPAKQQKAAVSTTAADSRAESKPNSASKPGSPAGSRLAPLTAEMRRAMIAEAAYYIAAQRGFGDGRAVEDWLIAEKQIDASLSA